MNSTEQYERWSEAIRSMIKHENELQNNRLTWLLTCQGFFTAALAFAWNLDTAGPLITIISLLGIFVPLIFAAALRIGQKGKEDQRDWWDKNVKPFYPGPDVQGYRSKNHPEDLILLRPWRYGLPALFVIAWLTILFCYWCGRR